MHPRVVADNHLLENKDTVMGLSKDSKLLL